MILVQECFTASNTLLVNSFKVLFIPLEKKRGKRL